MSDAPNEKYAFLQLAPEVAEELGLPPELELPIRADKYAAASESGQVPLPDMADGIIQFLAENEAAQATLMPALGPLAAHAAFAVASEDEHERANNYFGIACEVFPDDFILRANYARSFLFLENADAALVEYLEVLDHPDVEFIDFVWFDAALLLANAEDFDRAEKLLSEFLENEPDDEQATKLLADLKELRGDEKNLR
jgi:hypothetical protein